MLCVPNLQTPPCRKGRETERKRESAREKRERERPAGWPGEGAGGQPGFTTGDGMEAAG